MSTRKRRSVMVTSNLVFSQWDWIFPRPDGHGRGDRPLGTVTEITLPRAKLPKRWKTGCAQVQLTTLYRSLSLVHHAVVIEFDVPSYRTDRSRPKSPLAPAPPRPCSRSAVAPSPPTLDVVNVRAPSRLTGPLRNGVE